MLPSLESLGQREINYNCFNHPGYNLDNKGGYEYPPKYLIQRDTHLDWICHFKS